MVAFAKLYDADGTTLVAGYDYDGLNRRVVKETYTAGSLSELRHYYYSRDWQVLEERKQQCYGSSGSASAPESLYPERQFVWGLRYVNDLILRDRDEDEDSETGDLGVTDSGLDERLYALQDPNWNVVAIANTSGAIQERFRYDAYGKPKFLSGVFGSDSDTSSYSWDDLYTGRQYDANTGLYHYRNRDYHALLGRFTNRDPIGYEGGDANLYRYVGNSPANHTDPSGHIIKHIIDAIFNIIMELGPGANRIGPAVICYAQCTFTYVCDVKTEMWMYDHWVGISRLGGKRVLGDPSKPNQIADPKKPPAPIKVEITMDEHLRSNVREFCWNAVKSRTDISKGKKEVVTEVEKYTTVDPDRPRMYRTKSKYRITATCFWKLTV